MNKFRRTVFPDLTALLSGSILYATAVCCFIDPQGLSIGGFTGLGAIAQRLWNIPIGSAVFLLNLPLLILSYRRLGRSFFFKTALAALFLSLALDGGRILPPFPGDRISAAGVGGILSGAGLGLIFRREMATGGSDLLAKLLHRRFRRFRYGMLLFFIDGAILFLAAVLSRDLQALPYSALTVYLSSAIIDRMLWGNDRAKAITVVTEKKEAVLKGILETLPRGVTVWSGEGGYTGEVKAMILTVLRSYELPLLRRTVEETDPNAFLFVSDTCEVAGKGFRNENSEI